MRHQRPNLLNPILPITDEPELVRDLPTIRPGDGLKLRPQVLRIAPGAHLERLEPVLINVFGREEGLGIRGDFEIDVNPGMMVPIAIQPPERITLEVGEGKVRVTSEKS